MTKRHNHPASGNVMVYVLIGIILFAALSFTLTRTTRGTATIDAEKAALYAHQITGYADKVDGAVNNVMLQNRCLASLLSFENSTIAGYTNGSAPNRCKIFDRSGGGMNYEAPPSEAIDTAAAAASAFGAGALTAQYLFAGNVCVDKAGSGTYDTCFSDGSTSNEDLVIILPWVKKEVCDAINNELGNKTAIVTDAGGSFGTTKFTGSFADGYAIGAAASTMYNAGCYQSTGAATPGAGYHFYHVLSAR